MPSVLVIGGGPAGACYAARMAQLGASVLLVEAHAFPRRALGESLTPGVHRLLAATGAGPAVAEARFPAAADIRVSWEGDTVTRVNSGEQGMLVDRGAFDQLLIAHAAREGVRVLQPAEVVEISSRAHGWQAVIAHEGARELVTMDFLADARGRNALAASPRQPMGQRTLAVFGYWRGEGLPTHATVAAGERGWFWGVPLPDGSYNAQAFLSPRHVHDHAGETLEQRYRALIAASPLAEGLACATLDGAVRAVDATPYLANERVTASSIRLGDAALSLDPISSSGVQKAIQSALAGAIVTNTLLRRPAAAGDAQAFYNDSLARTAARHAAWAGQHYAAAARTRHHEFWTSRAGTSAAPAVEAPAAGPDDVVCLSPLAELRQCPCLGDEFVEVKQALLHPALDGPVAYLDRQAIGPLLAALPQASRIRDIAQGWAGRMPLQSALAIAAWLTRKGVLVPQGTAPA